MRFNLLDVRNIVVICLIFYTDRINCGDNSDDGQLIFAHVVSVIEYTMSFGVSFEAVFFVNVNMCSIIYPYIDISSW